VIFVIIGFIVIDECCYVFLVFNVVFGGGMSSWLF